MTGFMHRLAELDHRYVWHPFTQMQDWLKSEPILIVSGKGARLRDAQGRSYLDANASIWTNLHGHNHPKLNAAIQRQMRRIAHSSALGLANEPAARLAEQLIRLAPASLSKVFYSDDGSTAVEVALKIAYEYTRRSGRSQKPRFLSLASAYHGDTLGAVSVGHIDLFHKAYAGLLFESDQVMAPYCYRCPFNRAKPERADARDYRRCRWECVDLVEKKLAAQTRRGNPFAAMVVEPLIQGAAGMIPQPEGWLGRIAELVHANGALLIADEVMTGFGRVTSPRTSALTSTFGCHVESVQPDLMTVAKGLTGGYLPLAATLASQKIFDAFLGEYAAFRTFFHGHSYTANQLGCAAALASLALLAEPASLAARRQLHAALRTELQGLWSIAQVGDIRQVGLITGIELVRDWPTRQPFDLQDRIGQRVAQEMARRGVLTRPIGNVIVLMPPYCTTARQVRRMVETIADALRSIFGQKAAGVRD